jgi:hypothetical protein
MNARLTEHNGHEHTAHLYHIPERPALVLVATVGAYEENEVAVRAEYAREGYYLVGGEVVSGAPS